MYCFWNEYYNRAILQLLYEDQKITNRISKHGKLFIPLKVHIHIYIYIISFSKRLGYIDLNRMTRQLPNTVDSQSIVTYILFLSVSVLDNHAVHDGDPYSAFVHETERTLATFVFTTGGYCMNCIHQRTIVR